MDHLARQHHHQHQERCNVSIREQLTLSCCWSVVTSLRTAPITHQYPGVRSSAECEARCKLPIHQIKAILSSSVCLTTIHWFLMFHQTSQLTASVPLLVSSIQFAHIPLQNYKVCNPSGSGLQRADCINHGECLPANGAHQAQCCSAVPSSRHSETRQDSRTAFRDSIF